MKHIYKSSLLIATAAILGSSANVFAYFSYPASRNCAECHDDGRTWQSIHGGGGTPAPTPPPLPPPIYYNGVLGAGNIGNGNATAMTAFFSDNGFVVVAKKVDGTFTGSLRLEGKAVPFKGKFNPGGNATVSVAGNATVAPPPKVGKKIAQVALSFDPTVAPGVISGTVTTGGSSLAFTALPSAYTGVKTDIHPLCKKRYTVVLPSPGNTLGHGYATLVFDAKGVATFAGKLADGTAFTTTSRTVDDGMGNWVVPLHIALYKTLGVLTGEVALPKTEPANDPDVFGSLQWLRPADAKAKAFLDGFLKELAPAGERYPLLAKGISLISKTTANGTFTITVDPASVLTPAVTQAGTWPGTNIPLLPKPANASLKLTFIKASGIIKGSFVRSVLDIKTNKTKAVSTPYEGVMLANPLILGTTTITGGGFFSTGPATAPVELTTP